ncbi:FAD synthase [Candidatus Bathyarchaeota archaeon]|nr:FAD synthase [Candidatus Bathyarchaeota archaeon]
MAKKHEKKKIVLASGAFDLLHLGHVRFLEEAKRVGGIGAKLIVAIAKDTTVEKNKGTKTVMPENQRKALVESLKVVDGTVLGSEEMDIGEVIDKIKPDLIAFGYDQIELEELVRKYLETCQFDIQIVRIRKFGQNQLNSSSKIKQKIKSDFT